MSDTIVARASGTGRAGIAVFRLSGPGTAAAVQGLTGRPLPPPRQARRVAVVDAAGLGIDDGLLLWFPAPASFTGEDVAEFHLHGGRAVAAAFLRRVGDLGIRPAEPGEFSKRAVLNGKIDLTRAEAIADLVDAETEAQRRQAKAQLDGGLERRVEGWRGELVDLLAWLEASIDFSDDGIGEDIALQARSRIAPLLTRLNAALADGRRGERLRDGVEVAIIGAPNAGKSSLLNRIAGREAAIVSATAGTTRDIIEVHLDLNGLPVTLADTAGLRDAASEIEAEGIRRALARADRADLKIAVFTAGQARDEATAKMVDADTIIVVNKADLAPVNGGDLAVSARTGDGIDTLLARLTAEAERRLSGGGTPLNRERHRVAVAEAVGALTRAGAQSAIELAAEEVRAAGRALGRITGRIDAEEILDVVFRDFCIGK